MGFNLLDLLLPREIKFFSYLNKQAEILNETAELFKDLITNLSNFNGEQIKEKVDLIKEHEKKGDKLEHFITNQLDKTFITPLDREDIHSISIHIDTAIDLINSTSQRIYIYQIRKVPKELVEFSNVIIEASVELRKLIFNLKQRKDLTFRLENIHQIEKKADQLFYLSTNQLFKSKLSAVEIIKLKEICENLEEVVDSIYFIAKIIRGIIVKQG